MVHHGLAAIVASGIAISRHDSVEPVVSANVVEEKISMRRDVDSAPTRTDSAAVAVALI